MARKHTTKLTITVHHDGDKMSDMVARIFEATADITGVEERTMVIFETEKIK